MISSPILQFPPPLLDHRWSVLNSSSSKASPSANSRPSTILTTSGFLSLDLLKAISSYLYFISDIPPFPETRSPPPPPPPTSTEVQILTSCFFLCPSCSLIRANSIIFMLTAQTLCFAKTKLILSFADVQNVHSIRSQQNYHFILHPPLRLQWSPILRLSR